MEISSFRSMADLGVDDSLFYQQWPVDDEMSDILSAFSQDFQNSCSSQQPLLDFKRPAEWPPVGDNRTLKQLKSTSWSACKPETMTDSPLHLVNSASPIVGVVKPKEEAWFSSSIQTNIESIGNQNYVLKPCQGVKRISSNNGRQFAQAQDHILAERKRREKLSQRFIALSALLPGLKKMDKASILGDAIKYMQQLHEKVKTLEEQAKKKSMESVVFVKKYEVSADGENSSTEESSSSGPIICESLPEIEARFCGKEALISIHCEKKRGALEKIVAEIEKLRLSVINSSAITFGDALNVTIIAQKDEDCTLNMKELVKNIRGALKMAV